MLLAVLIDKDSTAVTILRALKVNVDAVIEGLSETLFEQFDEEEIENKEQEESVFGKSFVGANQREVPNKKQTERSGKKDD